MLEHGGRLRAAAQTYGIPLGDWLDLSTGINPATYPLPAPPPECWARLPEDGDGLEAAAAAYYGSPELLPVAGSQAAIQALPEVLPARRIAMLAPCYAEHQRAWSGRELRLCSTTELDAAVAWAELVLLIHPNNPTGERFAPAQLREWQARLARRGAWLVVDEAFMDAAPGDSLLPSAGRDGLVVLRSLGKFFGLAGARVGFVFAPEDLRRALAERLGPWTLSGPARWAAGRALRDVAWQETTRAQIARDGARLHALLSAHGLPPAGGTALFQWCPTADAARLHDALARDGILVRRFDAPAALRFGLPGKVGDWSRLEAALAHLA